MRSEFEMRKTGTNITYVRSSLYCGQTILATLRKIDNTKIKVQSPEDYLQHLLFNFIATKVPANIFKFKLFRVLEFT